jgi:hypothetical protein
MILREPVPHVRGKQERLVTIDRPVPLRHAPIIPTDHQACPKPRRPPGSQFRNSPCYRSEVPATPLGAAGLAPPGHRQIGRAPPVQGPRPAPGRGWREAVILEHDARNGIRAAR